jgi:hypothetical protein
LQREEKKRIGSLQDALRIKIKYLSDWSVFNINRVGMEEEMGSEDYDDSQDYEDSKEYEEEGEKSKD